MKIEENNTVSSGKLMISDLRTFQTYEHHRFRGGVHNSEVLLLFINTIYHPVIPGVFSMSP